MKSTISICFKLFPTIVYRLNTEKKKGCDTLFSVNNSNSYLKASLFFDKREVYNRDISIVLYIVYSLIRSNYIFCKRDDLDC